FFCVFNNQAGWENYRRLPKLTHRGERFVEHIKHQIRHRLAASQDQQGREQQPVSKQAILLLVVHGLFAAANALSGTFVNVFLWKAKNDFALLGWFALAGHVAGAVTFYCAGKWVKEHNKMNSLRLGVALSAGFYLSVL